MNAKTWTRSSDPPTPVQTDHTKVYIAGDVGLVVESEGMASCPQFRPILSSHTSILTIAMSIMACLVSYPQHHFGCLLSWRVPRLLLYQDVSRGWGNLRRLRTVKCRVLNRGSE